MAISPELARSLDSLRLSIIHATDRLAAHPASEASVKVNNLANGEENWLIFDYLKGKPVIAVFTQHANSEYTKVPVLELPVRDRILAASYVPDLIRRAEEKARGLPEAVDAISGAIEQALAECQSAPNASEVPASVGNINCSKGSTNRI